MRTIDLSGPEGNAFCLIGMARNFAKQIPGKDGAEITARMQQGDYEHLLDVFEQEFGAVVELTNRPGDFETCVCTACDGGGCDECDWAGEIAL